MMKFAKTTFAALVMVLLVSPVYADAPMEIPGTKKVSAAEAKVLFDKGIPFVDVRPDADWNAGRIPEAEHLDSAENLFISVDL